MVTYPFTASTQHQNKVQSNKMPSTRRFFLHVIVYFGLPRDFQKNRHVALFFEARDGLENYTYHAKLVAKNQYRLDTLVGHNSLSSVNIAGTVEVGEVKAMVEELQELMRQVPITNDGEFNCQIWAETALAALARARLLREGAYLHAVDKMIDTTMEAMDEP